MRLLGSFNFFIAGFFVFEGGLGRLMVGAFGRSMGTVECLPVWWVFLSGWDIWVLEIVDFRAETCLILDGCPFLELW